MNRTYRLAAVVAVSVAALGALVAPTPAQAWWRGGWGWGGWGVGVAIAPPLYVPPPVYYAPPPPVYYAPPPAYYSQPQPASPVAGQSCYAGDYICPLNRPLPPGTSCSCPGNGGRVYGRSG